MKKTMFIAALTCGMFTLLTAEVMNDSGQAGAVGSPGEGTCWNGCHNSFALNSGAGSIELRTGTTNNEYVPGQTYSMTFKVAYPGRSLFGMGLEALNSANTNAGSLVITDAARTRILTSNLAGSVGRKSVTHTLNGGTSADSMLFNFNWVAPAAGTGNVTFYFCGNAANGNATSAGDYIYQGTTVLTERNTTGIEPIESNIDVNVFPSVINDEMNIRCQPAVTGIISIQLFDLQGKLVRSESSSATAQQELTTTWNGLSSLGKGTYLLNIQSGERSVVKRIIIQ
jgi:hypothetical protein